MEDVPFYLDYFHVAVTPRRLIRKAWHVWKITFFLFYIDGEFFWGDQGRNQLGIARRCRMVPNSEAHGNGRRLLFCSNARAEDLEMASRRTLSCFFFHIAFSESDGLSVTAKSLSAMSKDVWASAVTRLFLLSDWFLFYFFFKMLG